MATSKPLTIEEFKRVFPKEKYTILKNHLEESELPALLKQHNFGDDIFDLCKLREDLISDGFFVKEKHLDLQSLTLDEAPVGKRTIVKEIEKFDSPSITSAKPSTLNKVGYKHIHYHRRPDQPLHTSLYDPILAELYDNLNGLSNKTPSAEDCKHANLLSSEMSKFYSCEDDMYSPFRSWAEEAGFSLKSTDIEGAKTDGSFELRKGTISALILNSEIKHNGCNADIQNLVYYCKYWAKEKNLWERSVCPTVLLSLQGTDITVSGAVFINSGIVCDFYYSCSLLPIDHDIILRTNLARTVMAIKIAAKSLEQYYENCYNEISARKPVLATTSDFPYLMSINQFEFTYIKQHPTHNLVFEARSGETDIIVKFARTYSVEAHQSCPIAPRLLAHSQIKGGWHVIAMEKITGTPVVKPTKKQAETLRKSIAQMHSQSFVHGDLRPANILVSKDGKIHIIDFDWAGVAANVKYPLFIKYANNYPPGAIGGTPITKEHDIIMLNKIL